MLSKSFSTGHFEIFSHFFFFFSKTNSLPPHRKQDLTFHECKLSNPIFWENKKNINLSAAEFAKERVVV